MRSKKCQNCGAELHGGAYCPECGGPVKKNKARGKKWAWILAMALVLIFGAAILFILNFFGVIHIPFLDGIIPPKASGADRTKPQVEFALADRSPLDKDGNGVIDCVEYEDRSDDTDGDGLSDYDEIVLCATDPMTADTDGDGIVDPDDDSDGDGLTNAYELSIGTLPACSDSDMDGLDDRSELESFGTDPLDPDSDKDGAQDGWEIGKGCSPLSPDTEFTVTEEADNGSLHIRVVMTSDAEATASLKILSLGDSPLINDTIPGCLGGAFSIETSGEFNTAEIAFALDADLLSDPGCRPTIYWLNEQTQTWRPCSTVIEDGMAKTTTTHFSTYILLNSAVYEQYLDENRRANLAGDTGVDSNDDGISDYVTKLMCDGVIRTGTGALIFEGHTYEEVQANNDIDGDGIPNGEEIGLDYMLSVPEEAREFNGHYYCVYNAKCDWYTAASDCAGLGGYLATVSSEEENAFILSLIQSESMNVYWLGGYLHENDNGNESWEWYTGEEWGYTKWGNNKPDNYDRQGENRIQMYRVLYNNNAPGTWNDATFNGAGYHSEFYELVNTGYVCEWGEFQTEGSTYAYLNSSPIYRDSDGDGFFDFEDTTPLRPTAFRSMKEYVRVKYPNQYTISIIVKQPKYGTNKAMDGGVGHAFIMLKNRDGECTFRGFYPAAFEGQKYDDYMDYALKNIFTRGLANTAGTVVDDETHDWDISYTEAIEWRKYAAIMSYLEEETPPDYNLQQMNCTTFAVALMEAADTDIDQYTRAHLWAIDPAMGALTLTIFYPYGYYPGGTGYDLMNNAPDTVVWREITLADGTKTHAAIEGK